jgi:hypothetical protein
MKGEKRVAQKDEMGIEISVAAEMGERDMGHGREALGSTWYTLFTALYILVIPRPRRALFALLSLQAISFTL